MFKIINQLGMALFIFVVATGLLLWWEGILRIGEESSAGAKVAQTEPCSGEDGCKDSAAPDEAKEPAHVEDATAENADSTERKCEHDVNIIDCNECRYEAGVVAIDPAVGEKLFPTGQAEVMERSERLHLTGEVKVDETRQTDVMSISGGRVSRVKKSLGESVEKGEILAVVHSSDLGKARTEVLEAKAALDLAQATFERASKLWEKRISSEVDFLNAQAELNKAKLSYASAQKNLSLLGTGDSQANESFNDLPVRSPMAGVIVARNVSDGVVVNSETVLFRIADLSQLWVWCSLREKDLAMVHQLYSQRGSLDAQVRVGAFPEETFPGVVDLLGSEVDEHTRTVKVRATVKNAEGKLKPGMFTEVEVLIPSEGTALYVPQKAVVADEGTSFVFKHLKGDLWARQNVLLARNQGDMVEVAAGLEAGDRIVVSGAFLLKSDLLREKMGAGCAD